MVRLKEPALVLVAAAVAGAALALIAYTLGYKARLDLCIVVGLAVGLTWRLSRLVVPPDELPLEERTAQPDDDGRLLLTSLESRLSWGASDPDRFRERVRPELVALATDLLRTRRGIDPRTQPDQARTVLGASLWQLMTGPLDRSPSRAELTRMVEALERI